MTTVDANPLKAPIVSSTSCLNFECCDNQLWTRLDRFIGSFVIFSFFFFPNDHQVAAVRGPSQDFTLGIEFAIERLRVIKIIEAFFNTLCAFTSSRLIDMKIYILFYF